MSTPSPAPAVAPVVSPIPEIFILWHPACNLGEKLARRIYAWLRPGSGLGPNVFYRSLKAPEGPDGGLPPPLPGEKRYAGGERKRVANVQVILPLIDAHMVSDASWRQWLTRLGDVSDKSTLRVFMPAALDTTAFNIPVPLRQLNFIRPAGLPLPDENNAAAVETVARSLCKQLTAAFCRLMLGGRLDPNNDLVSEDGDAFPKLKVFLSHAKTDGAAPARRLRDYIYSQTQFAAFYDENDIAFGSMFARILEQDLNAKGTAALIAVRSENYAIRPWCRRELSLFRRPRRDTSPGMSKNRWRLYPVLVVDALEGGHQTPGIPEIGNSPYIRWDEGVKEQEELIVTTVLRNVMLSAFHSALGATIPEAENRIVINWLPDPTTLLHIDDLRKEGDFHVIHPGRGLSGMELDTLAEFFPNLTFHSFEELLA